MTAGEPRTRAADRLRVAGAIAVAALVNAALFLLMERMVVARPTGWEDVAETLSLDIVSLPPDVPPPGAERPPPERRDLPDEPALDPPQARVPPLRAIAAPQLARVAVPETELQPFGVPSLSDLSVAAPDVGVPVQPDVHVTPRYPRRALARGIEGRVVVAFTIEPDGTTSDLEVLESDPPKVFDRSALDAVRQWRYAPRAEPRRQTVPIEYELAE